jgi:hypothetical protein
MKLQAGEEGRPGSFAVQIRKVLKKDAEVRQPQWTTARLVLGVEDGYQRRTKSSADSQSCTYKTGERGGEGSGRYPGDLAEGDAEYWLESMRKYSEPQCFKCLNRGRLAKRCRNEVIRDVCCRCGENGQRIREYRKTPKCPLCTKANNDVNHILGGFGCARAAGRVGR